MGLIRDIVSSQNISPDLILGHSDISPYRESFGFGKTDPGVRFFWKELAEQGYGFDVQQATQVDFDVKEWEKLDDSEKTKRVQEQLHRIGYGFFQINGVLDVPTQHVIAAYRMRFMPESWIDVNSSLEFQEKNTLLKNLKKNYDEQEKKDEQEEYFLTLKNQIDSLEIELKDLNENGAQVNGKIDLDLIQYLLSTPRFEYNEESK